MFMICFSSLLIMFLTPRMISPLPRFYFDPSSQRLLVFSIIKHTPLKQIWPYVSEVITKIFVSNRQTPNFHMKNIHMLLFKFAKRSTFQNYNKQLQLKSFVISTKPCSITKCIKSQVIRID